MDAFDWRQAAEGRSEDHAARGTLDHWAEIEAKSPTARHDLSQAFEERGAVSQRRVGLAVAVVVAGLVWSCRAAVGPESPEAPPTVGSGSAQPADARHEAPGRSSVHRSTVPAGAVPAGAVPAGAVPAAAWLEVSRAPR